MKKKHYQILGLDEYNKEYYQLGYTEKPDAFIAEMVKNGWLERNLRIRDLSVDDDVDFITNNYKPKTMEYQFAVRATDKHDGEVACIEAKSLEEAKQKFAESFPDDVNNIDVITSDNGYEEIR